MSEAPSPPSCVWISAQRCDLLSTPPPTRPPGPGYAWLDVTDPHDPTWPDAVQALTGCAVRPEHVADCRLPDPSARFEPTPDYAQIVFRAVAWTDPHPPREALRITPQATILLVFPNCLVSVGGAHTAERHTLRTRLLSDTARGARMPEHPDMLMLRLLNDLVDRYLLLRRPLTERLDALQRALLDPRRPFNDWLALLESRRQLRKLENLSEEQLDTLQEWRDTRLDTAGATHPLPHSAGPLLELRCQDLVQHIERVRNHARRLEAAAESAVQLHFSATAHRTNQIMRTLTVITAVFMPLNLITGLFGMNFEALPGIHSPSGFWWILGAMVGLSVLLMGYFRARRYLEPAQRRRRRGLRP